MSLYDYYYTSAGTATAAASTATPSANTVTEVIAALSPTAHWRLNEASGTAVADETGTHGGTAVNSPTFGATGWAADGDAFTFTSADTEYVEITDHADLEWGTGDATYIIAVDMGTWNTGNIEAFVAKGPGTEYLIGQNTTTDRLICYFASTSYNLDITTDLTDGWHLLMFTIDRDGLVSVYVDGAGTAEATANCSATSSDDVTGSNPLRIASGDGSTTYRYDGSMQHVAYWKGSLISTADFSDIYNARDNT